MIVINKESIADVPVLHIALQKSFSKPLPLIIFQHGFTSIKERNLHYAYLLAEKGFRVILPEANYHGERSKEVTEEFRNRSFWNIVIQSIEEIGAIINEYQQKKLIQDDRIGVAGTSMGGMITFGALTKYPYIKVGVSLMGCPSFLELTKAQIDYMEKEKKMTFSKEDIKKTFELLKPYDLTLQKEKLHHRPLLFWHSTADKVVPYSYTYRFYENIKNMYINPSENLKFITDEKAGHAVTQEGVEASAAWFYKHL
ncbi:esterase [Bacillus taeanensis]|uniref:Esterase n=1 Tax=Bacillus taeanensis TaxID=273032 RepID=A0A366XWJ6_9BACI|nr:esterase [Bacillus taeanensis]RBW69525.1 esterase [Bacillus taeanensis]